MHFAILPGVVIKLSLSSQVGQAEMHLAVPANKSPVLSFKQPCIPKKQIGANPLSQDGV